MAYLEINCSNFIYENNKIYIDLANENITNISDFTHTDELYAYIQYAYKLTNGETVYDVLFENNIPITDGSYSQTNPVFFIGLNSSNNEYGKLQVACNNTPLEVKLILSTPDIEMITPTKDSKVIVSTNVGYSTIDYSFKALTDVNSAKIFCKDIGPNNSMCTYYFGGLNEYGEILANTIISNTIDVRDMFTELSPVNGKIYTIGVEVGSKNRFYSYNWVEFILSDGQYMNVK